MEVGDQYNLFDQPVVEQKSEAEVKTTKAVTIVTKKAVPAKKNDKKNQKKTVIILQQNPNTKVKPEAKGLPVAWNKTKQVQETIQQKLERTKKEKLREISNILSTKSLGQIQTILEVVRTL